MLVSKIFTLGAHKIRLIFLLLRKSLGKSIFKRQGQGAGFGICFCIVFIEKMFGKLKIRPQMGAKLVR